MKALGILNLSSFLYQTSEQLGHYLIIYGIFEYSSFFSKQSKLEAIKLFLGGRVSFFAVSSTYGFVIFSINSSEKSETEYFVSYHSAFLSVYPSKL